MHWTQRCAWRTCANVSLQYPPFDYSDVYSATLHTVDRRTPDERILRVPEGIPKVFFWSSLLLGVPLLQKPSARVVTFELVFFLPRHVISKKLPPDDLSGLPNANAKSPRFTYAISKIATLPPVVALNRSSKSQIAARYAAFWHAISQIALPSFL